MSGSSSGGSTTSSVKLPSWYNMYVSHDTTNGIPVDGGTQTSGIGQLQTANQSVSGITNGLGLTAGAQQGIDAATQTALANQSGQLGTSGLSYLQNLVNSGGLTSDQSSLASSLINGSYTSNPSYSQLSSIASGDNIGQNQYTDQLVAQNNQQLTDAFKNTTVPTLDNSFLASGRGGSGLYAQSRNTAEESLADAMSSGATQIYNNAYNTDTANQMSALNSLNSLYQSNVANQLSGANLQQQGISNVGSSIGLGNTANTLQNADYQTLLNLSSAQTGSAYNNASNYLNALLSATGQQGTTINTGSSSGGGAGAIAGGALGGAASGAAIGSAAGPYGTAIGAVGGGLLGAFGGAYS